MILQQQKIEIRLRIYTIKHYIERDKHKILKFPYNNVILSLKIKFNESLIRKISDTLLSK